MGEQKGHCHFRVVVTQAGNLCAGFIEKFWLVATSIPMAIG